MKTIYPGHYSSLCAPDDQKSCFGCCPPIRPAGYDHLDHRAETTRILEANTLALRKETPEKKAIYGDQCWGLGYLDPDKKRIGCLLHPAAHHGRDYRDSTGYGDKCRRELCREAKIFSKLQGDTRILVLEAANGLDSFQYSSRSANPAFHILKWGTIVTESMAVLARSKSNPNDIGTMADRLNKIYKPETDGYGLERIVAHHPLDRVFQPEFIEKYISGRNAFIHRHRRIMTPPSDNRPFVHQLEIPGAFARFLRSALQINRCRPSEADSLLKKFETLIYGLV